MSFLSAAIHDVPQGKDEAEDLLQVFRSLELFKSVLELLLHIGNSFFPVREVELELPDDEALFDGLGLQQHIQEVLLALVPLLVLRRVLGFLQQSIQDVLGREYSQKRVYLVLGDQLLVQLLGGFLKGSWWRQLIQGNQDVLGRSRYKVKGSKYGRSKSSFSAR